MCPTYEPTSMSCTCALFVSAPLCKEASQLPGELAAYHDGKPQFSSRPGVPWECLTTNQRQCPGSQLRSVWGVYAASWKDVHVFLSNGDTSVLCFDAQQLRKWPRTGDLELCHTSEYLEGCLGGEVEGLVGGTNGKAYLELEACGSQKRSATAPRTWDAVAHDVTALLQANVGGVQDGLRIDVTPAVAQSASCKLLQAMPAVLFASSFKRARDPADNFICKLSPVGERLLSCASSKRAKTAK